MKAPSITDRFPALVFLLTTTLVPNIAILVGGFHGFFLTHLAWSTLMAIAIPLLLRRGRGSLPPEGSALIALLFVSLLFVLGLIFGFDFRRYPADPASLLTTMGVFLVGTLGAEVGRSAAMSLSRRPATRVALGTLSGMLIGVTLPALLRHILIMYASPLLLIESFLYSLTLSLIHEFGGLASGAVFRILVDGYWRFSPLVLTTSIPPALRSAMLSLTYYGMLNLIIHTTKGIQGSSHRVFKFGHSKRVSRLLPEFALITTAVFLLILGANRFVPLVVTSGSMSPALEVGDVVFVHAIGSAGIRVGDIAAFVMEGKQIVVHRVVDTGLNWVKTKGDANPDPDPFLVSYKDILGIVAFTVPRLGYVSIAFQAGGWTAYSAIAVLAAAAISVAYMRTHMKNKKLKFYPTY